MKSFVINLERREDRKSNVEDTFRKTNFQNYAFYKAVDGKTLKGDENIYNLFYGNDFGWRKGVIGCALSHYNLWKQLKDEKDTCKLYCIFEDDFSLRTDFLSNLKKCEDFMLNSDTDILMLGYHMFKDVRQRTPIYDSFSTPLQIEEFNNPLYIGGFFGYMISKRGVAKLLQYIETNGIRHGIDYLIKINSNLKIKECRPHIIFSDWVDTNNSSVDTDIQKDYNPLEFPFPKYQIVKYNNNQYKYYPGLDSCDNDILFSGTQTLDKLFEIAEKTPCVAFNSLGFFKSKVNKLTTSPYIDANNGLYVKTQRKTRVKLICNWCTSSQLCNEWNHMSQGNYTWNDIQVVADDNADYFVIVNKPLSNEFYIPEKTIVFQMEPWCYDPKQHWGVKTWGEWAKPDENKFLQVRSHDKFVNNCMWQLKTSYNEFKYGEIVKDFSKGNMISTICSSKYFDPGHIKRIDFLKYCEKRNDPSVIIHVYNHDNDHQFKNYQGPHQSGYKDGGILPYKYYFMGENNEEYNFVTEKMFEPLLTESLCFYWGCPNISEIFDPRSYVLLDLSDFEKSFNIIKDAIENNLWEQRLPIIRQEKQRVLDYYNFFPTLERVIQQDRNIFPLDTKIDTICFIHSCNLPNVGTAVLDELYSEIVESGLMNELDYIVVNNIGVRLDKKRFKNKKVKIINHSEDTSLFELPTIEKISNFSKNWRNCKLLYLHTKGITHNSGNVVDWRKYLSYFMINKHEECLEKLSHYDAVGCNYLTEPYPHFSGNFWWANTDYIQSIDRPLQTRHDPEWWILSNTTNFYPIHNSNINHYHSPYPKFLYVTH